MISINDLAVRRFGDIAHLHPGQFRVKDQQLRIELPHLFPYLGKFARADTGSCFGGRAALQNGQDCLTAGSFCQFPQFFHRTFCIVFSRIKPG